MRGETLLWTSLIASLAVTGVALLLSIFPLMWIIADLGAGQGSPANLVMAMAYWMTLLALPLVGLRMLKQRLRLAWILQGAWIIAASPIGYVLVVSAIPPVV